MAYTKEPRSDVYCFKLNFNISNVGYFEHCKERDGRKRRGLTGLDLGAGSLLKGLTVPYVYILFVSKQDGAVCLHAAARRGHVGVVKALLSKGATVDTKTKVRLWFNI